MPFERSTNLKAIDFFCGAGGMSFGLRKAGINVLAGIDNDLSCKETYSVNNSPAKFIHRDVSSLTVQELAESIGISLNDDYLILVGCSPCQYWSKIQTDRTKSAASAFLLKEFQRFVDELNPGFILIENVPGILKNRKSYLSQFLTFLVSKNYFFDNGIINSNLYGVPQNRMRYVLIGTRLSKGLKLPKGRRSSKQVVRNFIGTHNNFPKIEAGHQDHTNRIHTAAFLSPKNLERIRRTPHDGGTRESWKDDEALQIPAYNGKDNIFRNVYGRMFWDQPAPTITTRFNSFSNGRFGHPVEDRAISLREGATLQTFPRRYKFMARNQSSIARQIGNAVPPALSKKLGEHIIKYISNG